MEIATWPFGNAVLHSVRENDEDAIRDVTWFKPRANDSGFEQYWRQMSAWVASGTQPTCSTYGSRHGLG